MPGCQKLQMITHSGTGCFIAVPIWQQRACELAVCCVAVDRCGSLKPPRRGLLMCSAGGGDDHVTICRLVCPRGLTLPRPTDNQLVAADQFQCRPDVGVWTPTDRVPSCVGQFHVIVCFLSFLLLDRSTSRLSLSHPIRVRISYT